MSDETSATQENEDPQALSDGMRLLMNVAGTIESMTVENFMHLSRQEFRFEDPVNFFLDDRPKNNEPCTEIRFFLPKIIRLALGGKVHNIKKKLFKDHRDTCTITLVLSNRGSNAFKASTYGSSISIVTEIKKTPRGADGSRKITSSFSLRNENGEEVSSREEDLKELLTSLNILMPLPVLGSDGLREVLKLSGESKYELFSSICEKREKDGSCNSFQLFDFDKRKGEILNKIRDLEKQKSLKEETQSYNQALDDLETEYSWAKVFACRDKIVESEQNYEEYQIQLFENDELLIIKMQRQVDLMTFVTGMQQMCLRNRLPDPKVLQELDLKPEDFPDFMEQKVLELDQTKREKDDLEKKSAEIKAKMESTQRCIHEAKKVEEEERQKAEAGRQNFATVRDLSIVEAEWTALVENLERLESETSSDLTVEELTEKITLEQDVLKNYEKKLEDFQEFLPNYADLQSSQESMLRNLRKGQGDTLQSNFQKVLGTIASCLKGRLSIDHDQKVIEIKQIPMKKKQINVDTNCVSSPEELVDDLEKKEHKLLTISFIIALWMSSSLPFFILASLEDYLIGTERSHRQNSECEMKTPVNTKCKEVTSLCELMMLTAREKPQSQFFIFTRSPPYVTPSDNVSVYKMQNEAAQKRAAAALLIKKAIKRHRH